MLPFVLYAFVEDDIDYGAVSSLEFKDSQAAKSYVLKQISTANSVGKMSDIFAMSLFEYVKTIPITTPAAEMYALTEAETIRLVNVVGIPAPDNYDKWLSFLASAEDASLSAAGRAKEATFSNVVSGATQQTVQDIKDTADPRKSPWPWIIGGAVLLYLYRQ